MYMIRFSVIIPAYNEEKYIAQCLDAITHQDFPNNQYEIILVNNNSTDRTKEIASRYARVRVIDESKQGCVHALIRGCNEAHGEFFAFTDADTIVPVDWLSKYNSVYRNSEVVFASGPGHLRPTLWCTPVLEFILYWCARITKLASGFNMSVRKTAYEAFGGFGPKINFDADVYLGLKAKKNGKAVFVRDNWVVTSSRRYQTVRTAGYLVKTLVNIVVLVLLGKTVFYEFRNVRK